jgi:hypothetical protein
LAKSKRIEGAPWLCKACYNREVRTFRFFPPFHANANARRSPPRFVSDSPRAVRVSRSSQHTEMLTAAGTTCVKCGSSKTSAWCNSPDVPGRKVCKKCYLQEFRQDNPHEQEEEEVSVRVLYFLSPRFPRSRRSFDDAPFSPDAALPTRNAFDAIVTIDTIAGSE